MTKFIAIVGVSLSCLSVCAMAASFNDYDLDKDGMISKSEAQVSETLTILFERLDKNDDGLLSKQEFAEIEY